MKVAADEGSQMGSLFRYAFAVSFLAYRSADLTLICAPADVRR
jgi:hypothetical protein